MVKKQQKREERQLFPLSKTFGRDITLFLLSNLSNQKYEENCVAVPLACQCFVPKNDSLYETYIFASFYF